ncbi:hypothetical protein [Moraxella nasicaprae]|uniref:Uncharacterized protein n=1 Tax=Moraxella nasicaprae TaxID=2904122 RepID=A0ABY6F5J4_9GAMM|nr:hypothetical protein [Moraxella nasicaprae]UXZ05318.1 hypothetical protein LU297_02375 [Moraxella nasicaprae]
MFNKFVMLSAMLILAFGVQNTSAYHSEVSSYFKEIDFQNKSRELQEVKARIKELEEREVRTWQRDHCRGRWCRQIPPTQEFKHINKHDFEHEKANTQEISHDSTEP